MTVIRMSVATVTASLAAEISLCAVIVYNHCLGRRKWRYNSSIKPAGDAGMRIDGDSPGQTCATRRECCISMLDCLYVTVVSVKQENKRLTTMLLLFKILVVMIGLKWLDAYLFVLST